MHALTCKLGIGNCCSAVGHLGMLVGGHVLATMACGCAP